MPGCHSISKRRERVFARLLLWVFLCFAVIWALHSPSIAQAAPATHQFRGIQINPNFTCGGAGGIVQPHTAIPTRDPFSYTFFVYQEVMFGAMAEAYCAVQQQVRAPLSAAVVLAVIAFAVSFLIGITNLTAREAVILLFKVGLVVAFAMNADVAMRYAFQFFIGISDSAIGWLDAGPNRVSVAEFDRNFREFAAYLNREETAGSTTCAKTILYLLLLLTIGVPLVGAPIMGLLLQIILMVARTLIGFLVALGALAMLMAVSPIFIAFALFKSTYTYFNKWLTAMISYALQMTLVFAIFQIAINTQSIQMMDFFEGFVGATRPTDAWVWSVVAYTIEVPIFCSPCEDFRWLTGPPNYLPGMIEGINFSCGSSNKGVGFFGTFFAKDFFAYLAFNFMVHIIVIWGLVELLVKAPQMAYKLAGDNSAMSLGGSVGRKQQHYDFDLPGFDKAANNFLAGFRYGYDPYKDKEVKEKIQKFDPDYLKTSGPFAPFQRFEHGVKVGLQFARMNRDANAYVGDLPELHYKERLMNERIAKFRESQGAVDTKYELMNKYFATMDNRAQVFLRDNKLLLGAGNNRLREMAAEAGVNLGDYEKLSSEHHVLMKQRDEDEQQMNDAIKDYNEYITKVQTRAPSDATYSDEE